VIAGSLVLIVVLLVYIAISTTESTMPFSVGDEIEVGGKPRTKVKAIRGHYFCFSEGKYTTKWYDSRKCGTFVVYR
jgi:hypothetical protein